MFYFNNNLKSFLHHHHHPELEQLHNTLIEIFERRMDTPPLSNKLKTSEMVLLTATSATLLFGEQIYAMIVFGCYIGGTLGWSFLQQNNMIASEEQLQTLYYQSELFARRYPHHAHVDQAVRYLVGMDLSQKSVAQLIRALGDFAPSGVMVETREQTNTRSLTCGHLRL